MNLKSKAAAFLAAVLMISTFAAFGTAAPASAQAAEEGIEAFDSSAHDDQIIRLYRTVLGRYPDIEGAAYWTQRRLDGESLVEITRVMIHLPEVLQVTSGDLIVDAYDNAFDRVPDTEGYNYWTALDDPARAITFVSDSPEHREITGTIDPPAPIAAVVEHPAGWVDAGYGVYVPPILLRIRWCESHDNYTAANPTSSARGAYQFLSSSWRAYGHAARYGVSTADQATPAQQDEAAVLTWQQSGTRPWYPSSRCW